MSTIEYNLSDIAQDLAALAGEWEEQEAAMIADQAVEYNAGFKDGNCARPRAMGLSPAYLEGFDDGRREWREDGRD